MAIHYGTKTQRLVTYHKILKPQLCYYIPKTWPYVLLELEAVYDVRQFSYLSLNAGIMGLH